MDIKVLKSEFVYSVPTMNLMRDMGAEICFIGRSNVGKSSLINALCQKRDLARTSKLPGRTRHAVFYEVCLADESSKKTCILTDLPGFGYASMSKTEAQECEQLIFSYIRQRQELKLLVLLLDMRRQPDEREKIIISIAKDRLLPIMIVLTKSDKIVMSKQKMVQASLAEDFGLSRDMLTTHSTHDHASTLALRQKLFSCL